MIFHSFTPREKMKSADDRHRQLECTVCFKKMRSNNLKRHMRKHRDLYSLAVNDLREEIRVGHTSHTHTLKDCFLEIKN